MTLLFLGGRGGGGAGPRETPEVSTPSRWTAPGRAARGAVTPATSTLGTILPLSIPPPSLPPSPPP